MLAVWVGKEEEQMPGNNSKYTPEYREETARSVIDNSATKRESGQTALPFCCVSRFPAGSDAKLFPDEAGEPVRALGLRLLLDERLDEIPVDIYPGGKGGNEHEDQKDTKDLFPYGTGLHGVLPFLFVCIHSVSLSGSGRKRPGAFFAPGFLLFFGGC
jgi:hypothetical protein